MLVGGAVIAEELDSGTPGGGGCIVGVNDGSVGCSGGCAGSCAGSCPVGKGVTVGLETTATLVGDGVISVAPGVGVALTGVAGAGDGPPQLIAATTSVIATTRKQNTDKFIFQPQASDTPYVGRLHDLGL